MTYYYLLFFHEESEAERCKDMPNRQINSSSATQTQVHLAAEPPPLATKPHCNTASCFCTSHLPGVLAFLLPPVAIASIAPRPSQISWHQTASNIHIALALPPTALEGSRHAPCPVTHDRDGAHVCLLGHSAGGLMNIATVWPKWRFAEL